MNRSQVTLSLAAAAWLSATSPGCTLYDLEDQDAGQAAFIADAIPTLLGRPAKGTAEVKALQTLFGDDREAVVTALTHEPDFVDYWSQVIVDDLGIERIWTGPALDQARTCYSTPVLDERYYPELVAHLTTKDPALAFCVPRALAAKGKGPSSISCDEKPFNMLDVIRAAIATDRLDVLYLAYLGPIATLPFGGSLQNTERSERYREFYLDRDPSCLTCHTTTYSTTDERPTGGNWDRTFPVGEYLGDALTERYGLVGPLSDGHGNTLVDLEGAAFSTTDGSGGFTWSGRAGYGGNSGYIHVGNTLPFDNDPGSLRPWGLDASCVPGGLTNAGGGTNPGSHVLGLDVPPDHAVPLMRAYQRAFASLRAGYTDYYEPSWGGLDLTEDDEIAARASLQHCFDCHPPPGCDPFTECAGIRAPDLSEVLPTLPPAKLATILLYGSRTMEAPCRDDIECARRVVGYLRTAAAQEPFDPVNGKFGIPHGHAFFPRDRTVAVAQMLATVVADHLFEEVFGSRLTIGHGFSRTPDQADVLVELTTVLLNSNWSLRAVLETLIQSPLVNRAAPFDAADDDAFPLFVNPWTALPPGDKYGPGGNGPGDAVHRKSIPSLLQGIHQGLGWPAPMAYSLTDTAYPSTRFQGRIGRYKTLLDPGQPTVQLREFIYYEDVAGRCVPPAGTTSDWVDALVTKAGQHPTATIGDVFIALKDRLITDPSLADWELAYIEQTINEMPGLQGPLPLDGLARDAADADLEAAARLYCGVLLRAPDYMLTGVRPNPASLATTPVLVVPLDGEPNGYLGWCHHYDQAADRLDLPLAGHCNSGNPGGSGGPMGPEQPL